MNKITKFVILRKTFDKSLFCSIPDLFRMYQDKISISLYTSESNSWAGLKNEMTIIKKKK